MSDLDDCKQDILRKLKEAGAKGLSKGALKSEKPLMTHQAIKALEKQKLIANLGNAQRTLYVLQEFNTPLKFACEKIENAISERTGLFSRTGLKSLAKKGSVMKINRKLDEAIDLLVKENKLLKLKYGKNYLFFHISAIQSILPAIQKTLEKQEKAVSKLSREQVLAAYHKVRQRIGFSNVEIYELQQELGVSTAQLKELLLKERQEGRAILSFGDWSLSSENIRSGAIHIDGKSYLLVRFKE